MPAYSVIDSSTARVLKTGNRACENYTHAMYSMTPVRTFQKYGLCCEVNRHLLRNAGLRMRHGETDKTANRRRLLAHLSVSRHTHEITSLDNDASQLLQLMHVADVGAFTLRRTARRVSSVRCLNGWAAAGWAGVRMRLLICTSGRATHPV